MKKKTRNGQKKEIRRVSAGQRNREKERKRTWRKECTGVRQDEARRRVRRFDSMKLSTELFVRV